MSANLLDKTEEKKQKRLGEFKKWLENFQNLYAGIGEQLNAKDNAAEILNEWYWSKLESEVYPNLDGELVNHYKIISGTELSIVAVLPFDETDELKRRQLNAKFAWFVGLSILIDWNDLDIYKLEVGETFQKRDELIEFQREHLTWLTIVDTAYSYPIFSNAETWRLLHFYVICILNFNLPQITDYLFKKNGK